jgi:type II restriction/modification system DNA methylase subunit YeeA
MSYTLTQVEENLEKLVQNFSEEEFIFDLLLAYGLPKNTITLLKKGMSKLTTNPNQIISKKKLFFQKVLDADLHLTIDALKNDQLTYKHNPRFIIVTDYKTILALDTKTKETLDIKIAQLPKHGAFFMPWTGQEKYQVTIENDADVKAAYKMAKLYDEILKDNPISKDDEEKGRAELHSLNIFLSRLLFCFFAEDTEIFPKNLFTDSVSSHTKADGSDLADYLNKVFEILNTPPSQASLHNLGTMFEPLNNNLRDSAPSYLTAFPYVNGGLFGDKYYAPKFTATSRKLLVEVGGLQWKDINPDIFGSMIQAVVHPDQRSGMGMHYTSVPNIMKVIEPLFLSELREEFENNFDNPQKLKKLLERVYKLKIFDPACGSGNFLIIAYKELRKLEMDIFIQLQKSSKDWAGEKSTIMSGIRLSQFYGIELDDFAHEVAILSLWLAEHQMNVKFKQLFGSTPPSLPLREGGNIVCANATRIPWEDVCSKTKDAEIYILGNPPYRGYSLQDSEQKKDMEIALSERIEGYKNLDYISAWFVKASDFINSTSIKVAFVTTNSIAQGQQVELLWRYIFSKEIVIFFCYSSFKWNNNAKKNAGVYVTIIGLCNKARKTLKSIYNENKFTHVENINGYLVEAKNIFVSPIKNPLSNLPKMLSGLKAGDDGNLTLSKTEKEEILRINPEARAYIKRYIGAKDFMNGIDRYCIWVEPEQYKLASQIPELNKRFEKLRVFRQNSKKLATKKKAEKPYAFDETNWNKSSSILIPQTGSERREYLPVAFLDSDYVISNGARAIYNAPQYIFGILSSKMHIVWVKAIAGRLKMDMQYSNTLCYNTFPVPDLSDSQKQIIEEHVYNVLGERENHSEKTMAQLYDPDKMPTGLREAHHNLDIAVERCYRLKPFNSDEERLEYLFKLYEEMTAKENNNGGKK